MSGSYQSIFTCFFFLLHMNLFVYLDISNLRLPLTHYSSVLLFYTPWKHQKTFRFSDNFRGYRKLTLSCNRLITQWPFNLVTIRQFSRMNEAIFDSSLSNVKPQKTLLQKFLVSYAIYRFQKRKTNNAESHQWVVEKYLFLNT